MPGISPSIQVDCPADTAARDPDKPDFWNIPDFRPRLRRYVIVGIWCVFLSVATIALAIGRADLGAVAILSLALSIAPVVLARRLHIVLPLPFVLALASFLTASLLLGEAFDVYERIWWWDIALHLAAATGLGMAGFLFVLMLFEGDRFAAPTWALTMIAVCIAVTLGVAWELFEFGMDQVFNLSMQKSGLRDTMGDLLADLVGAALGAIGGALYLIGSRFGYATILVDQFVRINHTRFRKRR